MKISKKDINEAFGSFLDYDNDEVFDIMLIEMFFYKPKCPFCGNDSFYAMGVKRVLKCSICLKKFSYFKGTILENLKMPLCTFFLVAVQLMENKNISSMELARSTGLTQKSAYWMKRKILPHITGNELNLLISEQEDKRSVATGMPKDPNDDQQKIK